MPSTISHKLPDQPGSEYIYKTKTSETLIGRSLKQPTAQGYLRFFFVPYPNTPYTHVLKALINNYRETDSFARDISRAIIIK